MPRNEVRLEGVEEALINLNREVENIKDRTVAGLLAGGLIIQREAQQNVPVEYGNLRGSAYTRKAMGNANAVEVGFTAAYALYVHENLEQTLKGQPRPSGLGVYWGPNGGPKFLERAVRDRTDDVVRAVASYASRR